MSFELAGHLDSVEMTTTLKTRNLQKIHAYISVIFTKYVHDITYISFKTV